MIEYKQIHGTQEKVEPIEMNYNTIYIRNNIKQDEEGWVYDEIQMSLQEYLSQIIPQNQETTDEAIAELSMLLVSFNNRLLTLEGKSE